MDDIHWTETALADLNDIASYIALDSPRAAEAVVRRIVDAVRALIDNPRMGRPGRHPETRELVVPRTPYVVIYRQAERVEIVTIFHASRKWPGGDA